MSVWKKIPLAPGGVMPAGLVTKIGVAAISLLLAAMLLTYSFTGGGGPEAEIEVPEAAGFDLQQRAAAAIEAEARRQAGQLRQQADAAERQLAQLQAAGETGAVLGAGFLPPSQQDSGTGLLADDQPVPFGGDAPRSEAEAVLLETLRLEEMERRRRSLRTEPLVLSYRNSGAGGEGATAAGGTGLPPFRVHIPGHTLGPSCCSNSRRDHCGRLHCHRRRVSPITRRTQRSGTGRDGAARAGGGCRCPFSCPGAARDGNSRGRPACRSSRLGPHP